MKTLVRANIVSVLAVFAGSFIGFGQMSAAVSDDPAVLSKRPAAEKIAEAVSAGPPEISKDARVLEMAAGGKTVELRAGANSWTCMPKQSATLPAMCADPASMQWMMDFAQHKPRPTNTVPGITYMLVGATQRSDSDPYDKTKSLDPNRTSLDDYVALRSEGNRPSHYAQGNGAYIMWAGTPYAHVHVMGSPYGVLPGSADSK